MTRNAQVTPCAQPLTLGTKILRFWPVRFLFHYTGSEPFLNEILFFKGVLYETLQQSSH